MNMQIDRKAEDNLMKFAYNDSLMNSRFEEILDIISEKIKSERQLLKNKSKIISLLDETFPGITADKLANGFNILLAEMQELPFKNDSIKEINNSVGDTYLYYEEIKRFLETHKKNSFKSLTTVFKTGIFTSNSMFSTAVLTASGSVEPAFSIASINKFVESYARAANMPGSSLYSAS